MGIDDRKTGCILHFAKCHMLNQTITLQRVSVNEKGALYGHKTQKSNTSSTDLCYLHQFYAA